MSVELTSIFSLGAYVGTLTTNRCCGGVLMKISVRSRNRVPNSNEGFVSKLKGGGASLPLFLVDRMLYPLFHSLAMPSHPTFSYTLEVRGLVPSSSSLDFSLPSDFVCKPSEYTELLGRNGSGKTTFLRAIAGLVAATWETFCILDHPSHPTSEISRRQIGYVGHRAGLFGELATLECLESMLEIAGRGATHPPRHLAPNGPNRTDSPALLLEEAGLADCKDRLASTLSNGQQRRLALAALVGSNRRIWLLDESGSGLDASGHAYLRRIIARHLDAGGSAIITGHPGMALLGSREI